jgi:hypothetical protein
MEVPAEDEPGGRAGCGWRIVAIAREIRLVRDPPGIRLGERHG